jgi:hypothetical protein
VATQSGFEASDDDAPDDERSIDEDAFAGLVAIDIVDGELVPRRSRPRR